MRVGETTTGAGPSVEGEAASASSIAEARSAGGRSVSSHQGRVPLPHRSDRSRNEALDASSGVSPPPAAALHAAARNSSVVATRSAARARMRSGSEARIGEPAGSRSRRDCMPLTRIGARDSMPGAAIPSAARVSISAAPGRRSAASRARARTAWVRRSSRQGTAHRPSVASPRVRWSETEKARMSSTSSPHSSTRSGWGSWGGKTSRIPPRTLIWPRPSTMSTRS